jgi:ribonuclease HII
VDEKTIDRINIYQATINGMYNAILSLKTKPQQVLIDAVPLERLDIPSLSLIKGDAISASIAAASIVAKVERDHMMDEYDKMYPEYGFAQHKGYGTAQHVAALKKYGPCPIHRRSFEPVKSLVKC